MEQQLEDNLVILRDIASRCKQVLTADDAPLSDDQRRFLTTIQFAAKQIYTLENDLPDLPQARVELLRGLADRFRPAYMNMIGSSMVLAEHAAMLGQISNSAEQREQFNQIHAAVTHMRDGFEQTLRDSERQVEHRRNLPPEYFDLAEVAEDLLPIARYWLRDKPLRLFVQIRGGIPLAYGYPYSTYLTTRDLVLDVARIIRRGDLTLTITSNEDDEPEVQVAYQGSTVPVETITARVRVDPKTTQQGSVFWARQEGHGGMIAFSVPLHPRRSQA